MADLLPCPFCGGEAERLDFETVGTALGGDPNAGGSCISCKQCGASSPVHFDRKENLYSSWNERINGAPVEAAKPKAGWRLVPVEPTDEMHKAAWASCDNSLLPGNDWPEFNAKVYRAMIAAAPEPTP